MLRSACELIDYTISASDGEIGNVEDFYFDDVFWVVRYLVANTGTWLRERLVLLSPSSLLTPDWERGIFPVEMSRRQIEESPKISFDQPTGTAALFEPAVFEPTLHEYYGWPDYTGGGQPIFWSPGLTMYQPELQMDPHLRSVSEVVGYSINATDRDCGTAEDLIVDDSTWEIKYISADVLRDGIHKKILIPPAWIKELDWEEASFQANLTADEIFDSPEYDPSIPINMDAEERLVDYYGRPYHTK